MSSKVWLVLDANYLCWRAFYAMRGQHGGLSSGTNRTEIVFGFLRDVVTLQNIHNTNRIVFCFDRGKHSVRKSIYPQYKMNRKSSSIEEEKIIRQARQQIWKLRTQYLPELGFLNILSQKGYEADDVIASVVDNVKKNEEMIIVGADSDLYQLLSKRVLMWKPKEREMVTFDSFKQSHGILPRQWALVKAIAGCSSDNVAGVCGVGDLTALRYVRGELQEGSTAYKKIEEQRPLWESNLKLVSLPFPGTHEFNLVNDRFFRKSWDHIIRDLELKSLKALAGKK